jgi:hypothetical protein
VSISPGWTLLTRMPLLTRSKAADLDRPRNPHLAEA